jgi:TetR/AcrR family transcriptional repressor of mexJK operon
MSQKRKRRTARPTTRGPKNRVLARGRRGRPTLDEVKAINAAVVEVAHNMFLNEGYNTASMEAIAKRAGVSKKTLYARFPTKGELFTEVVETQVAAWSARAGRYDNALGTTLRERLEHHAIMFLEANAQPEARAFERILLSETRHFPELGRIYHETAIQFALNLLVREIETAAAREGISVRDAHEAALTFMEALSGWSTLKAMLGIDTSAAERRRAAKYRVAVFMEGRTAW